MIRRFLPHIAIASALILAFLLGQLTATPGPAAGSSTPGTAGIAGSHMNLPVEATGSDRSGRSMADVALAAAAGKPLGDHATMAITEKTGLARAALFEALFARLTKDNWRDIFDVMWRARQESLISEREHYWYLQRVGEVAGADAMERFKPGDLVKDAELFEGRHAMCGWAQADPAAAMAWIDALPEGNYRLGMADGFVRGVAGQDVKAALTATAMLPPEHQQALMYAILRLEDGPSYLPFVQQWFATSDAGPAQAQVFGQLINAKVGSLREDPDGSKLAQWSEQFIGQDFVSPQSLYYLAGSLADHMEGSRAMDVIDRFAVPLEPGQMNPSAVVMQRWSRQEPTAAQQWLNDHRDDASYDSAALSFAQNGAMGDPAAQRAWIDTIHDENMRTRALQWLAQVTARNGK